MSAVGFSWPLDSITIAIAREGGHGNEPQADDAACAESGD